MKPRRAFSLLTGVALLVAIAAYIEIARTTAQPSDQVVNSKPANPVRTAARPVDPAVDGSASAGNPLWVLPLKQLSVTRERPIFSPSRRPPPPATPTYVAPVAAVRQPARPAEPERPSVTLLGTIVGEAERLGVFLEPATRNIMRMRIGEDHQGWVLRAVQTREVTLAKGRQNIVLELPPPGGEGGMQASDFFPPGAQSFQGIPVQGAQPAPPQPAQRQPLPAQPAQRPRR